MREIKFRAWDEVNKRMIYKCRWQACNNDVNMVLMQYTGLKDKNGKEIYEGDIVHYNPNDLGMYFHCVNEDDFVISWHGGAFFVDWNAKLPLYKIEGQDIKVVGNIYENPELLEDKFRKY